MPSLDQLLEHTLLHTAARHAGKKPEICERLAVRKPRPDPVHEIADDEEKIHAIRTNHIWHWEHGPTPGIFHRITAKVRGMGMNYMHAMPVADAIVFDHVRIQRVGKTDWLSLPIADPYVIRKEFIRSGTVDNGRSSWWPCWLPLDASGLVVLGYELGPAGVLVPINPAVLTSEHFMPDPKAPAIWRMIAGEKSEALVVLDRIRYLVVLELCTGREDDTFVPGSGIGFARLHPLVWVISSEQLDNVEVQTTVQRPSHGMSHGDDTMESEIGLLVTADSNQTTMPGWILGQDKVIPYWSNFFCATESEPVAAFGKREPESYDHPLQRKGELAGSDPRYLTTRVLERAIQRRVPASDTEEWFYDSVTKLPRQGQIDNIHMAPRMKLAFEQDGRKILLEKIAMAPFCVHDCLHAHWRWGVMHKNKELSGFAGATPHQIPGGTTVPNNQALFVSFPNRHTLRLRAIAGISATGRSKPAQIEADRVKAGEPQVFNHHGFGYVSDLFPGAAAKAIEGIKTLVEVNANLMNEPYLAMPDTGDGWARLYWRLRYGGRDWRAVERLTTDWDKFLRPEES